VQPDKPSTSSSVKVFTLAAFAAALLSLLTVTACVTPEKCIFVYREGHRWEGRVFGRAKNEENKDVAVTGEASGCRNDAENALLLAADPGDQGYAALRAVLLAGAQLECLAEATANNFTQVDCDALSGANDVGLFPSGTCTLYTAKELAKGDPKECLPPDPNIQVTDGITTVKPPPGDDASGSTSTPPSPPPPTST
jgi:hypothetical protein